MSNYVIAGVGVATAFTLGATPQLILTSSTLQEESLSLSVTAEDIRGGMSNALISRYFHDSLLESTMTDAMFDLNYIALNAGGTIKTNNDSIVTEQVTVGAGGAITVEGTPAVFGGATYGWVSKVGAKQWETIQFTGKTATTALAEGEVACVRYNSNDVAMKYFTVPSSIIPSTVHMIMTYPLFAGGTSEDVSSKTQVGELIVDIPRFQFAGTFDMSLTSSGAATSNLSGQALASYSGTSCDDMGMYADMKLKLYDATWYDDLVNMYIDDAESEMAIGDTKTLAVYGVYSGGATGRISNSLLTFASDDASVTVDNTTNKGQCTGASAGTAHIEVKPTPITGKSEPRDVAAYAEITVTEA